MNSQNFDPPKNQKEIECQVYLALIIEAEKRLITHGEPVYGPERDMRKRELNEYKQKYYALLSELGGEIHN